MIEDIKIVVMVINLARRTDRLRKIYAETSGLGLDVKRVEAVDGLEIRSSNLPGSLTSSQSACFQSHKRAWRNLSSSDFEYALILEDDAVFGRSVNARYLNNLVKAMTVNQIDVLQVGWITNLYRRSLSSIPSLILNSRALKWEGGREIFVRGEFRAGSHAYLISKKAAALLSSSADSSLIPIDTYLGYLAQYFRRLTTLSICRLLSSKIEQQSRKSSRSAVDSDVVSR